MDEHSLKGGIRKEERRETKVRACWFSGEQILLLIVVRSSLCEMNMLPAIGKSACAKR